MNILSQSLLETGKHRKNMPPLWIRPGLQCWLFHLLAVWPRESHFTPWATAISSVKFRYYSSQGCCEVQRKSHVSVSTSVHSECEVPVESSAGGCPRKQEPLWTDHSWMCATPSWPICIFILAHLKAQWVTICVAVKNTKSESRLPQSKPCSPMCWLHACEQAPNLSACFLIKWGWMHSFNKYSFCTCYAPDTILAHTAMLRIQQRTKQIKIPGQNMYKMSLDHLVTPENKAAIQSPVKRSWDPNWRGFR